MGDVLTFRKVIRRSVKIIINLVKKPDDCGDKMLATSIDDLYKFKEKK